MANVMDFGAVGDGVADDTCAIQHAIDSLSSKGGTTYFPVPDAAYRITRTLTIGDGTSSTVSTKQGVRLTGEGLPSFSSPDFFPGFNDGGVRIKWDNATGAPMIKVRGPLQGWAVENLLLDGSGQATKGLLATSAQWGEIANLHVQDCVEGISLSTFNLSGYTGVGNVDSLHNSFRNTAIKIHDIANAFGIVLANDQGVFNADPDYNQFDNTLIVGPGGTTQVFGVYLQATDGNIFRGLHFAASNAHVYAIVFDYSVTTSQPSDNTFWDVDFGSAAAQIINNGSPSGATLNRILNIHGTNGQPSNPNLANLAWGYSNATP